MTANPASSLQRQVALRIVERVSAGVQKQIYITNSAADVVAGGEDAALGTRNDVAARAIAGATLARAEAAAGCALGLPLVHGGQIVGAIVLDNVSPQGEELAYTVCALAELIIHQMTVIERLPRQSWAREKFLFDLLHGHLAEPDEVVIQEAGLLGIDLSLPRVVALVAIEPWQCQQETGARRPSSLPTLERKLWLEQSEGELLELAREVLGYGATDISSFIGNRWLAILPAVEIDAALSYRQRIAHDMQRFIDALGQRADATATAGIGRYYDGWQTLAQSFADARFALETGRQIYGPAKVFMPGDLGVASFVCSNDPVLKAQLANHLLHQIAQEPELLHTIDTYLDADLSPSLAAERLHIHRHTLAHRLDKITRLTGLDPRRFHDLAKLHAALVLHRACLRTADGQPPLAVKLGQD